MAKLPCKKSAIEFVVWKDAVGESTRADETALKNASLAVNTNLGWVLTENDELIVLAHGTSSSGEVDHFVIPKNCIIERVALGKRKSTRELQAAPAARTVPSKAATDHAHAPEQRTI